MADHQAAAPVNFNVSDADEKNSNDGEISADLDLDSIPNQIGNAILQINGNDMDMSMSIVRQPTGSLSIADVKTLYNILLEMGTILSTDGMNVNIYNCYNNGNMEEESKEESKDVGIHTDANPNASADASADVNANANANAKNSVPSGSGADLVGIEGREKKEIDENTEANMNMNKNKNIHANNNTNKKRHHEEELLKRVNVDVGQYSYSMCLSKGGLVYMVKKQNTASSMLTWGHAGDSAECMTHDS
eukprot:CAMPEP_0194088430 /NCGR_PEP_ID=MMETSP0149-20130528/29048_1 /TAXON_ID=122233 /ORGANISM="Chaetoceros debilis, Strain MM31A-1" /LENGTH=247 /DNA_ID=CAMNT_0038772073 /DNA_START=17 /DNA_END=761 /DNA_ORIENTATION=+